MHGNKNIPGNISRIKTIGHISIEIKKLNKNTKQFLFLILIDK